MSYGKAKHAARCVADYSVIIPAGPIVDQAGRTICDVPEKKISYKAGEVATFSTRTALQNFIKASAGKWEPAPIANASFGGR